MSSAPSLIGLIILLFAFFATTTSRANIVFIGGLDIDIPTDFGGVYVDLQEGGVSSSTSDTGTWDLNFFFGGSGIANQVDLQPVKASASDLSPVLNLPTGTMVGAGSDFGSGFGGSGGSAGDPLDHMGGDPHFTNDVRGNIGFSWDHDGDGGAVTDVRYGWFEVTLRNDGSQGTIHAVLYETQFGVGVTIPEPGTVGLLAGLGLPLLLRRRRSAKVS